MATKGDGHLSYYEGYMKASASNTRTPHVISIHLVEARGLLPAAGSRTVNPFAVVSVCGRRERTVIQRSTTDCLWDTTYVFKDVYLSDSEFERENIYIQVFNANTFTRNDLIGQYSFALSRVHRTRRDVFDESLFNHQVYRKWVVLTHPKKPQIAEGLVMLSVTVLKPGEFSEL